MTCIGIFHPDFANGRPTYFDVSARNTLQPGNLNHASMQAGAAAAACREVEKDLKHAANVENVGGRFYPLVMETLGVCTTSSLSIRLLLGLQSSMAFQPH